MIAPSAPCFAADGDAGIGPCSSSRHRNPFPIRPDTLPNVNDKVYIHEFIDIIGHNRVNYMHHMTANWSPIAQEERHQLCYGVWAVIGTTREWPQVVNLWEEDGFKGLSSFARPRVQQPVGAGPEARQVVGGSSQLPAPRRRPRARARRRGPARSRSCAPTACAATSTRTSSSSSRRARRRRSSRRCARRPSSRCAKFGWELAGAWETAMVNESECFLLWSIPTFDALGRGRGGAAQRHRPGALAEAHVRPLDASAPLPARRLPALADADRPPAVT